MRQFQAPKARDVTAWANGPGLDIHSCEKALKARYRPRLIRSRLQRFRSFLHVNLALCARLFHNAPLALRLIETPTLLFLIDSLSSMAAENSYESLVEFREVSFALNGGAPIIDRLSLDVYSGETLVLLGESGCGKTTTLRLVNRLLTPTSGQILVEGRATTDWDVIRLRRRTGYVIQEVGLFPHFTVSQNVALVPTLESWGPERVRERVSELLSLVGLDPKTFSERYPHELSGGQSQRVGVARALAADPPVLLMDEPFGALDPITRAALQKEFAALKARLAKTVIFVTHDVREALMLGTRIALMDKGRIVLLETPAGFAKSEHELARAYLETLRSEIYYAGDEVSTGSGSDRVNDAEE